MRNAIPLTALMALGIIVIGRFFGYCYTISVIMHFAHREFEGKRR
jgi:hypothetical protein